MTDPILSTHGIVKRYGALVANSNISIDLLPNEIHAVIGPNGAGKSTLIAQICGTEKPDSGSIELLGKDITLTNAQMRSRAGIARTFQVSALAMEDTVLQNTLLGAIGALNKPWRLFRSISSDSRLHESALQALERVDLLEHRHKRTSELSHGQRRQLEVAVALTLKPKVFVMDEPMAGLGIDGSSHLTGILDALRFEAPILLVEHDMAAVFALADRISVLVYGEIIATGSLADIRTDPDVQAAYLGHSD